MKQSTKYQFSIIVFFFLSVFSLLSGNVLFSSILAVFGLSFVILQIKEENAKESK